MPLRENKSVFVVALLYSEAKLPDREERKLLSHVRKTICHDPILKSGIHLINIDNDFSRDILLCNESGVEVHNWPVFAIRKPGYDCPQILSLYQVNGVFCQVYKKYIRMLKSQKKSCPKSNPPQIDLRLFQKCNEESLSWDRSKDRGRSKDRDRSKDRGRSRSPSPSLESHDNNDWSSDTNNWLDELNKESGKEPHDSSHINSVWSSDNSEDYDVIIHWNVERYSGIKEVKIYPKDKILFISEDHRVHNLALVESDWKTQKQTLVNNTRNLKCSPKFGSGNSIYLIDTNYPDRMRLILKPVSINKQTVEESSNESVDSLSDTSADNFPNEIIQVKDRLQEIKLKIEELTEGVVDNLSNLSEPILSIDPSSLDSSKLSSPDESKLSSLDEPKLSSLDESRVSSLDESRVSSLDEPKLSSLDEPELSSLTESSSTQVSPNQSKIPYQESYLDNLNQLNNLSLSSITESESDLSEEYISTEVLTGQRAASDDRSNHRPDDRSNHRPDDRSDYSPVSEKGEPKSSELRSQPVSQPSDQLSGQLSKKVPIYL